jgi:hypothetical protein
MPADPYPNTLRPLTEEIDGCKYFKNIRYSVLARSSRLTRDIIILIEVYVLLCSR